MSFDQEPYAHPKYRQRLLLSGWIGVAMIGIAPLIFAMILPKYFGNAWAKDTYGPILSLLSTCPFIGAVLVLIGREHYPVFSSEDNGPSEYTTNEVERIKAEMELKRLQA